ncbi:MAG TPA: anthranilate phosphoribosyltransferase [Thermoanaerobaculia bacterium]|jgi:anthranilate phosphoribosyltransferase|nr:anthranilate phosphoribosyltransferase [Thermoanaerobaculia bacterium]
MKDPKEVLWRLVAGESLSREETEELFGALMDGQVSEPIKAALLVALRMKGEAVSEISGAAAAMRSRVIPIPHTSEGIVDTCGTGGDGQGTFNISTAAALVAAAAGVSVAKHGNRSVSSKSGSADVLAALGVKIEIDPATAGQALDTVGITFLFAPLLHPAMREVMPVRRELGMRTIFNVLGPLTNPAGARRQVMGVYSQALVEPIGQVLRDLGAEHALVVHGDGLDEITTTGPTTVSEVRDGEVRTYTLEPERFGLRRVRVEDLAGGRPEDNAALMQRVFGGETGPLADVTALNAGAAVYVAGLAPSLEEGVEAAMGVLASGAAAGKLDELKGFLG